MSKRHPYTPDAIARVICLHELEPDEFQTRIEKAIAILDAQAAAELAPPDFLASDCGSIIVLTPQTDAARSWCAEHLPDDCPRWGQCGYAIERRLYPDIEAGILADGLTGRIGT